MSATASAGEMIEEVNGAKGSSLIRLASHSQTAGLLRVEDVPSFHALPYGATEVLNRIPPNQRSVRPLHFKQPVWAFSARGLLYAPDNHHLWSLHNMPGIGQALMDTNLFETVARGTVNYTVFGSEKRGIDKLHITTVDNNVLPGQRGFMQPLCGVCSAIVAVDSGTNSMCGGCRSMWYCCAEHQRIHWPLHKNLCKQLQCNTAQTVFIKPPADSYVTPEAAAYITETHYRDRAAKKSTSTDATTVDEDSNDGPSLMSQMDKAQRSGEHARKLDLFARRGAAIVCEDIEDLPALDNGAVAAAAAAAPIEMEQ